MKIIAIIPAHNEADQIADTVASVLAQTVPVDRVVVVCDNCTDDTAVVAARAGAEVMWTVGNTAKKAGALNQAFDATVGTAYDFVLQMDADTILTPRFVAEALKEFSIRPELGGICARFLTKDEGGIFQLLQRMEYERLDVHTAHKRDKAHCLSGTSSLFRREALPAWSPWDEQSMVEDYSLTLDLREAGWRDKRGDFTVAYTETKPNLRELWAQRLRWSHGTLTELKRRGWRATTRKAMLGQVWAYFVISCRFFWLSLILGSIAAYGSFHPQLIWLIPLPLIVAERTRSVWKLGWKARLLAATFLADEFYQLVWEAYMLRALYLSARGRSISWGGGET